MSFGISFVVLLFSHSNKSFDYLPYSTWWFCRQLGTRESKDVTIEGRVQFDLFQVMSILFSFTWLVMDTLSLLLNRFICCVFICRLCKETTN